MKSVIISAVIAVAVVWGSIMYTNRMDSVSKELSLKNDEISGLLIQDNFFEAEKKMVEMSSYFDEKSVVLAAIGNHEELDNIKMNISELEEYIRGEEKTDALSRCMVLDFLFEHLPQNYKLRWENIL